MIVLDELFKYGYHDTYIDSISFLKKYIDIHFKNGIFNLDEVGRETTLTTNVKMRIYVDISLFSLNEVIEIREVYPKYQNISTKKVVSCLKKNDFSVENIYFSNFNNKILIECGCEDNVYLLSIEDCEKIEFIFK